MPKISTLHLLFLALVSTAMLTSAQEVTGRSDTLRQTDTTKASPRDTLLVPPRDAAEETDTLGRMSTPSLVGTLDRSLDSTHVITADDLHWLDYRYLGGILESVPGVFLREQFGEGQYNQLNIRGADWRNIAVLSDGRLLNDPASGIFNLFHFTTEYADRIEHITGPRSFLYGVNSSGGTINLLTKNYNSNRPFSKINYSESAYGYSIFDGTFSQNISRKFNLTFGFQHQVTDGRFPNGFSDAWNLRVKVRYNLSRDFNIIISEYLTRTETALNGGVDFNASGVVRAFDPLQATMKNTEAFEKITRHDIDLSFVATVLGDTANVSKLTFYYSNNFREYRDGENTVPSNGIYVQSDHWSSWMGGMFTQNFDTDFQRFSLGGNIELRQIEGSPNIGRRRNVIGAAWAKEEFLLGPNLTVAGFARYDRNIRRSALGVGGDVNMKLQDWISLYGGLSISKRFPTYQELYWTDVTVDRNGAISPEKHRQAEIGARLHMADLGDVQLSYFHRTVENPILLLPFDVQGAVFPGISFTNATKIITNGLEAKATLQFWHLYLEGNSTFLLQRDNAGTTLQDHPKLSGIGGVYFWSKLLNDYLDLKTGFRARFVTAAQGLEFNPEVLAYVPGSGLKPGFGSSVDFFLIAALGNAYVHLMWENLTNARYFITPYYPVLDRAVRFGVSWQFLD